MSGDEPRVTRRMEQEVVETAWGRLVWQVSAPQQNSELLTVGICFIEPNQANGLHYHPNCEEVLAVTRGRIIHSWNGQEIQMEEGDVIVIPPGVIHNARNIGTETAELSISFSSAYRETVAVRGS